MIHSIQSKLDTMDFCNMIQPKNKQNKYIKKIKLQTGYKASCHFESQILKAFSLRPKIGSKFKSKIIIL